MMVTRPSILYSLLLLAQFFLGQVKSQRQYTYWNVDERCPEEDENVRRNLQELQQENNEHDDEPNVFALDDETSLRLRGASRQKDQENNAHTKVHNKDSRDLQVQSVNTNPVTFNLKLYWAPGYCWQREWYERKWCLQCSDQGCGHDSLLWIMECNPLRSMQRFEWVSTGLDTGFLKVAGTGNLCLERIYTPTYRLRTCDPNNIYQQFAGFHLYSPFELHPANQQDGNDQCLTQDHHPKPYEELISHKCPLAREHKTSYWQVYQPSESAVSIRFPSCSTSFPCHVCEGDCTTDAECLGTLRCFQRGHSNSHHTIPGCAGVPLAHCKYILLCCSSLHVFVHSRPN